MLTKNEKDRLNSLMATLNDGDAGRFYSSVQLTAMNEERELLEEFVKDESRRVCPLCDAVIGRGETHGVGLCP